MKNKKAAALSFLFLISLQFLIGLNYFNLNAGEGIDVDILDPEISDIIVGNYTFPGVSGSITLNESIRIGLLDDMEDVTGDHAWKGALLAAREINEAGGITINTTQYYVGLVAEDTDEANETLDISKGIDAANKIISYDPHFIIGGYKNESVSAYLEPVMDAKIPFLGTGIATDEICQNVINNYARYKYFFRVMPINSTSIASEMITHLIVSILTLNATYDGWLKNVAILRENLSWSVSLSEYLQLYLPSYVNIYSGGQLTINEITEYNISTSITYSEMADIWDQVNASGAQLVIPLMSTNASIIMSKTYAAVQPKCLMEGVDVKAQINDFWDDTEGGCQYEVLYQYTYNTSKTSKTIPFWNQFVEEYNIEPFYTGIGSYEAVYMLGNVTFTSQSLNSDDIVTTLEGFNSTNPFIGPSGRKAFWSSHDLVEGYPYGYGLWCQWQLDGKKVVVPSSSLYPNPITTGSLSLPYWGVHNLTIAQDLPGTFTLSSDADKPDKDGTFDLTWSSSAGADTYSVFIYDKNISYISKRFALSSYKDVASPFTISGLKTGDYYCIVAAYNATGEKLSDNVYVGVERPRPGNFTLTTDANDPVDTDGTFDLNWTVSEGADNYSVFTYNRFITEINNSVTLVENQTAIPPYPIIDILTGIYFYVVVAYNGTGETMSNNVNVTVVRPKPGDFTFTSDADIPDTDGYFNLNWTVSEGADNYSVFTYNSFINQINNSVTNLLNITTPSPFPITGLMDGDYFYVVMAYNGTGETLSNNVYVKVRILPGQFVLSSDAELPVDDGNFNLTWTDSARAVNYSIFQYSEYITVINDSLTLIGTVQATNSSFEITGLDIGFYYYIIQAYNGYNHTLSNCIEVNVQIYDEISGYWNLVPFIIDDTGNGDYIWSQVATLPWCNGSGTPDDPYIIGFIKIDGKNAGSCIIISESNVSFIIKNSFFNNAGNNEDDAAGIHLIHVSNGGLIYLNCSFNNANGIFMESCQNINITSCSVNNNSLSGIFLLNCTNISIINNTNTISYNDIDGIHLVGSDNNRIIRNTINYNSLNGIFLCENSDNNYVDWNTLLGNGEAILDMGQNNYIGDNNIFPSGGFGFPFDIFLMVLIITIAIFGSIGAAIIVKKRISISGKKEKEISEKKKEKIRIKLEEKLRFVDHLIKEKQITLAYKNLGKVKDTADRYDFFAIFNQANKKVEICKDIEAGIYREVKREEPVMPVATEKAKEEKEIIPVIEERKELKVFLSYSTLDSDRFQIVKIVKHLEKFPEIKKVYYYTKDSGQNIVEYMEKTLGVCNIFVLFCTKHSKKSKAVEGEWQSAYQLVKRDIMKIIPVYEDEDAVPILLIPMLNIRYDKENFKGFINKLYQEILR